MERKRKNIIKIIVGAAIGVVVVAGLMFGAFKAGEHHEKMAVEHKMEALAKFIEEKVDVMGRLSELSELWKSDTDTIDKEGIGKYIEKLGEIKNAVNNDEIKSRLEEYASKWKDLEDIYDGKDNEKIMQAFDDIKASVTEAAEEIEKILNKNINGTVEELEKL